MSQVAQLPTVAASVCRECAAKFWEIDGTMPDDKLTAYFEMFHRTHGGTA